MDCIQSANFLEAVRSYIRRGFKVVPVPFRSKRPNIPDWPYLNVTLDNLENYFDGSPSNVGIILGARSNNLVDIDLDCLEARLLAPFFLPDTPLKSGRQSSAESHWWYRCANIGTSSYTSPERGSGGGSMIVEIRANGRQTIVPPSVHPSGEQIEWHGDPFAEPAQVNADELKIAVDRLAAASMIAARWHNRSRDELTFHLSGFFADRGMPQEEAERLIRSICQACDDEEMDSRLNVVSRTYERFQNGEGITGLTRLNELLSNRVISSIGRLLRLQNQSIRGYIIRESPGFALTDLGNAQRLTSYYGEETKYVPLMGKWLAWNGQKWDIDISGNIFRLAKSVVRRIPEEATGAQPEENRRILKHAISSESKSRIIAMIELAESEAGIVVEPEQLDRALNLLNCANGTVDLQTGILSSHRKEDLLTRMINISYNPSASCPQFLAFLRRIMDGNQLLIDFLRRAIGYSLTGETGEQVILFCHGTGANGKSTLINLVLSILGEEYATQASTDLFLLNNSSEHPTSLARLQGKRFVIATEATRGKRLNETLIKQVAGGDKLAARFMRQDFFEFWPQFKLWLTANHKPIIEGTDEAIWRRIRMIPFTVTIPEHERDRCLIERLKQEAEGILAWAVQGATEWYNHGLQPPPEVLAATRAYRSEMDIIRQFISERCCEISDGSVAFSQLYSNYLTWCDQTGEEVLSRKAVGQRLGELGFRKCSDSRNNRIWRGLQMRA